MPIDIPGAEDVINWFGKWPSFHDAEILSAHIDRDTESSLRLRVWISGDRTDEGGRFVREREAVVAFKFRGIAWIRLEGEDADTQNVISAITIERSPRGYRIDLGPSYGLAGEIIARELRVTLEQEPQIGD